MSDQTSGPGASGDTGSPDYQSKYNGLQAAFQKRINEHAKDEQAWQAERAAYEARIAELTPYQARAAAEQAEQEEQDLLEALQAKYEPGTPMMHSERRELRPADDGTAQQTKRQLEAQGVKFPDTSWP